MSMKSRMAMVCGGNSPGSALCDQQVQVFCRARAAAQATAVHLPCSERLTLIRGCLRSIPARDAHPTPLRAGLRKGVSHTPATPHPSEPPSGLSFVRVSAPGRLRPQLAAAKWAATPTLMQASCQARAEFTCAQLLPVHPSLLLVGRRHGAFCAILAWYGGASKEAARGAHGGHEGGQPAPLGTHGGSQQCSQSAGRMRPLHCASRIAEQHTFPTVHIR